jgi:hypothetical protein
MCRGQRQPGQLGQLGHGVRAAAAKGQQDRRESAHDGTGGWSGGAQQRNSSSSCITDRIAASGTGRGVIQPPAAIPPVFTSWSPATVPCRHGWSAALRAATLPAKRASSARTGFALGRCLGLPSPSPPSFPVGGAVGHGPAPGRRACTHRYAPPEIDRTAASPSTGACGRVPIGPFGAPVPTRSGDHRRAEEAVRSASPRGPPTTGGCGSSSSAVRDGVTQAQQVTTPRCTGVAELTGVELDGTPQSSSAGAGGLGACPGVRHRSQAMDVSIFDEKPDGLTPTTSGSGPMR